MLNMEKISSEKACDLLLGPKGRNPGLWAKGSTPGVFRMAQELIEKPAHRASCHRCGNMRKNAVACTDCPYLFCGRCIDKMKEEHGPTVFENGCPVVSNIFIGFV